MLPQYIAKTATTPTELSANGFTAPGTKYFAGWSETTDGATITHLKPTKDTTLYAIWTDTAPTYSLTAKAVWYDSNNSDNIRPDSLTVTINGSDYALNAANNWTYTADGFDSASYKWTMTAPAGYTAVKNEDNAVTTFYLRHTPAFVYPEGLTTVRNNAIVWQEGTTDNDETRIGYVGGDTSKPITFTRLTDQTTEAITAPTAAGNYYLSEDVRISDVWELPANTTTNISLNGHTMYGCSYPIFLT